MAAAQSGDVVGDAGAAGAEPAPEAFDRRGFWEVGELRRIGGACQRWFGGSGRILVGLGRVVPVGFGCIVLVAVGRVILVGFGCVVLVAVGRVVQVGVSGLVLVGFGGLGFGGLGFVGAGSLGVVGVVGVGFVGDDRLGGRLRAGLRGLSWFGGRGVFVGVAGTARVEDLIGWRDRLEDAIACPQNLFGRATEQLLKLCLLNLRIEEIQRVILLLGALPRFVESSLDVGAVVRCRPQYGEGLRKLGFEAVYVHMKNPDVVIDRQRVRRPPLRGDLVGPPRDRRVVPSGQRRHDIVGTLQELLGCGSIVRLDDGLAEVGQDAHVARQLVQALGQQLGLERIRAERACRRSRSLAGFAPLAEYVFFCGPRGLAFGLRAVALVVQ